MSGAVLIGRKLIVRSRSRLWLSCWPLLSETMHQDLGQMSGFWRGKLASELWYLREKLPFSIIIRCDGLSLEVIVM